MLIGMMIIDNYSYALVLNNDAREIIDYQN